MTSLSGGQPFAGATSWDGLVRGAVAARVGLLIEAADLTKKTGTLQRPKWRCSLQWSEWRDRAFLEKALDGTMKTLLKRVGLLLTIWTAACSSSAPAPIAPRVPELWGDLTPVVSVKELMRDMLDPLSDNIFNAVGDVITEKGVVQMTPKTDEDWEKIRIGAVTLAEGAYLLKIPRPFAPPGDLNNSTGPNPSELSPAQITAKVEADLVEWNARIEALRNVGARGPGHREEAGRQRVVGRLRQSRPGVRKLPPELLVSWRGRQVLREAQRPSPGTSPVGFSRPEQGKVAVGAPGARIIPALAKERAHDPEPLDPDQCSRRHRSRRRRCSVRAGETGRHRPRPPRRSSPTPRRPTGRRCTTRPVPGATVRLCLGGRRRR